MASTTNADDLPGTGDGTGPLVALADRTSLTAIDAALRMLPRDGIPGLFDAASAIAMADIARRMLQATGDFRAVMQEAAE